MPLMLLCSGQVIRIWEFRTNESEFEPRRIILRHRPLLQKVQITVDNVELPEGHVRFKWQSIDGYIRLIAPSQNALFSRLGGAFRYECVLGDKALLENNDRLNDDSERTFDVVVKIVDVTIAGDGVVWYNLQVSLKRCFGATTKAFQFSVHRRFRDFHFVYSQVRDAFRNTHMYGSIPKPPVRKAKLLEDHYNPVFLQQRKLELETWLTRMLIMPRVASNPDMETFLGGMTEMREVSVVIEGGSIGIRLKKKLGAVIEGTNRRSCVYPQAQVQDFVRGEDNQPGVAEASGIIGLGHVVSKIGGDSVVQEDYEAIIQRLKSAPRPLVLHFLGYSLNKTGSSGPTDSQSS